MGERDGDDPLTLIENLRAWNVPEAEIERLVAANNAQGAGATGIIEIEPENIGIVRLFARMRWDTEAVVAGNKLVVFRKGLVYEAMEPLARGLGVPIDAALVEGLGVMEAETRRIHNAHQERALRQR